MTETIQEEPKKKIIEEFMHTDEQGNPIIDPRTGKQAFTNLVAETEEEMRGKMREAYLNVTRALARARNHKAVPAAPEPAPRALSPEEERQLITEVVDPVKGREAIRKLAGTVDLEKEREQTKKIQDDAAAKGAAYQFMSRHLADYYPCAANGAIMKQEIDAQELDPRVVDNYEIAFNAVQDRLAQRPAPPAPPAPEPEPEPEQRRQAAGGIQPGELSGRRPIQRKKELVSKQQIAEWRKTPEGRAEYKKRLRDPAFVSAVNALFAQP